MTNNFEYRRTVLLEFGDVDTKVLHPQAIVLTYCHSKTSSRKHSVDLGCLCYSSRNKMSGRGVKGVAVELDSFDENRLPLVQVMLGFLRETEATSVCRKYCELKRFYNWLDALDCKISFACAESMKAAYVKYTAHLLRLVNASNIKAKRLGKKSASSSQRVAALIVAAVSGLDVHQVYALATRIRGSNSNAAGMAKLAGHEEQSRTFAALVNFIDEVHRVVVLSGEFPILFSSPNDQNFFYFVPAQITDKGQDPDSVYSDLWRFDKLPGSRMFHKIAGHSTDPDIKEQQQNTLTNIRVRLKTLSSDRRNDAYMALANRGVAAGLMTFMAATGTNLSVALELQLTTEEVVSTTQGKRFSGTKGRAKGKDVFPEFGAYYAPVFKKFKEIRSWLLGGRKTDLVFPYQASDGSIARTEASCLKELKRLIARALPNTVWVNAMEWRKNVGAEYLKLSGGDTVLASEKLGNTEAVMRSHYARPSFEDTAKELSSFFDKAYDSAIARTRIQSTISVTVIEDSNHPSNVPTGYCDKPESALPELAPGFTSLAPTPTCGEPVTCLFCGYYGVHADEVDVRRLLSLKYLLKSSKASMPNERFIEKFAPLLHRIDEVLEDVQVVGKINPQLVLDVKADVDRGNLDSFWKIHFNTFVTVGVVA